MNPLHLFEACGVEAEYMIVSADSLDVLPISDRLIEAAAGEITSEFDRGYTSWSNELVLHVFELKTTDPAPSLGRVVPAFDRDVREINRLLAPLGARLMPTAMHPWMDPRTETEIWPHEFSEIYRTYHRIFNCRRHGWANLQSLHLNFPFAGDEEFGRLHAAVRLVLPLIPALAASSPIVEGAPSAHLDARLEVYRTNAIGIPQIAGKIIPEPVYNESDYQRTIFDPLLRSVAELDPEGILKGAWLNSRGAIARFDRGSIEIRLIDVQECPAADLAIAAAIRSLLIDLVEEKWSPFAAQAACSTDDLAALLAAATADGERAIVEDRRYLSLLGLADRSGLSAGRLWELLIERTPAPDWAGEALAVILQQGPLARRILRALGGDFGRPALARVYRKLCDCLAEGALFEAAD